MATRTDAMKPSDLARVVIDTTVQPKAVMFPTDAKLLNRARERLVRLTKKLGVSLRQSYRRVGQLALIKHQRYAHAHQFKRANRGLRKYLGRVIRDPDCVQPTHPAQIRLKSGSSRPTELRNRTRAGMFVLAMLPANLSTAALLKGIDRNQIVLPIRLDAVAAEEDQRGRARRCAAQARRWRMYSSARDVLRGSNSKQAPLVLVHPGRGIHFSRACRETPGGAGENRPRDIVDEFFWYAVR